MAKNVKFSSPHLPSLPREYDAYFFENIHKSLRVYFNQLENHLRATDVEISGAFTASGEIEGGSLDINGAASIAGAITDVTTLTASGEIQGGSLDINGNADISGTLTSVTYQGDAIANAYIADLPTSKITSGTFADARIAASNVTQHQGSLTGTGALNSGSITSGFTSIDIGSGALTAGATTLNGATTVNDNLLEIVSTDAGATVNPIISLYRNSSSPAVSDDLGAIQFYGQDDAGNKTLYAQIHGNIEDETHSGTSEDGQLHISCIAGGTLEDPVASFTRSTLTMRNHNDLILEANSNIRFEGTSNDAHETTFYVEDPTADRAVNLPDASGVLEIGALASGAGITGTSIAHATFSTYKGQKIVFTGSGNCTIGLPDAASGDIGSTWTVCNAGSANVIFDLDASAAQTVKILTGAAVTDVGTDNPHIIPGGVASIVCTAVDNYVLFGSGVVDN